MQNNTPVSETAIIVASLRALSGYENDPLFNCNDKYAELFLPAERRIPLRDAAARAMIRKAIPPGMYEYVIARTKYFDDRFTEALSEKLPQVVILGAGFDSRPYRFAGLNSTTRIFETDTPATQAYKFSVLKEQGAETGNTEYVPVDFEKDELFENLAEHGYDRRAKTLFLWEGVTFYLTADAVTGVLNTVRQNSAPGSRICFDFQTVRNPGDLIKTGISENIKFGIEEGRVEDFLSLNHYSSVEHLGSKKIEQKFMKKATGELFGTISPVMNFLIIEHR